MSEENSVNVLTHFKNKKINKQKQSARRRTSLQADSLIFQSMHIYVILTQQPGLSHAYTAVCKCSYPASVDIQPNNVPYIIGLACHC